MGMLRWAWVCVVRLGMIGLEMTTLESWGSSYCKKNGRNPAYVVWASGLCGLGM